MSESPLRKHTVCAMGAVLLTSLFYMIFMFDGPQKFDSPVSTRTSSMHPTQMEHAGSTASKLDG